MSDKPGFVYVIVNPFIPGWAKIGHVLGTGYTAQVALNKRVSNINVADPRKAFFPAFNAYAACALMAEQFAHDLLEINYRRGEGEWFSCLPEEAERIVRTACQIARLRPKDRAPNFARALEEERKMHDDTEKILSEIADVEVRRGSPDVGETARAASAVIKDLLEMMAMPCENTEAAARAVLRRLDALGDK